MALLLGPLATAQAALVTVGGLEWRQLTETTNLSWNQVATVCDQATGACAGSLGPVSFDGWTWASNTDTQSLFDVLIRPGTTNFPTSTSNFASMDDPDIAGVFDTYGFTPTFSSLGSRSLGGWSRSTNGPLAYGPHIIDSSSSIDFAFLGIPFDPSGTGPGGAWLYRSVSVSVPEPGSLVLLVFGLLGLGTVRRWPAGATVRIRSLGVKGWKRT